MDGMTYVNAAYSAAGRFPVDGPAKSDSLAEQMKAVRKARLNRQALADPAMAGKLAVLSASPVYNASGDLIQAVAPVNAFTA